MRITAVVLWVGIGLAAAGCAPTFSGVQVVKANIAISAAETAGAKNTAPYEYTAAQEYLRKAREEAAYSDFAASIDFANKSLDLAIKARKKAETALQTEQPALLPPP